MFTLATLVHDQASPVSQTKPENAPAMSPEALAFLQAGISFTALRGWYKSAEALGHSTAYLQRIDQVKDEFLAGYPPSAKAIAAMQADILEGLRLWYKTAKALQKSPKYLERIKQLAEEFKAGQYLSEDALKYMQQDIEKYQDF
jgi:hypothetical protein